MVFLRGLVVSLAIASTSAAFGYEDQKALALYEEALAAFQSRTESGLREALRLFEEAASVDPDLARAHAGVADASCLLALYGYEAPSSVIPRAERAAARAIALDPSLAEAHAALGLVRYLYRWSFAEAEGSFRRAIGLNASYPSVHHWFGMMLMATGRFEESLEEIQRAIALEPASALFQVKRGTILMASGRLDDAEAYLRGVVEKFPRSPLGWRELGLLELSRGRLQEARARLERASELSGGADRTEASYGLVLALLGEEDRARAMIEALRSEEREGYVSPIAYALLYVGLRDQNAALDELERAFEMRDSALVYIRTQPGLAALREEPRFVTLVKRMGL